MSVDIDSLLLFRRQTAKTIDQLWDELRWCCFFCMRLNDFKYQWKSKWPFNRDPTYDTRQLRRNCRSHERAPLISKTIIRCWNRLEVFKIAVSFSNAIKWAYSAWEGDSNSRDSSDVCGRSASLRHNDDGDDWGIGDFHLGEFQARSAKKAGNLDQPTGIHAKNVWCCGDGYFGQKNLRKKCVNRDKM